MLNADDSNLLVFRTLRNKNYKTINLVCVQDNRLSWKAKGLHTYLITRPDNWEVRRGDLLNRSTCGLKSVYSGINELINAGYVFRIQKRNARNQIIQWGYLTVEESKSFEEVQKSFESNTWILLKSISGGVSPECQNVLVPFVQVEYNNKDNKGENNDKNLEEQALLNWADDETVRPLNTCKKKKIIRDNKPITLITTSVQRLILHWNSLGYPIPKHNINIKSKTYESIAKKMNTLLKKYSEQEIIQSMDNYKFVINIDFPILRPTVGKIVSLLEFMEFKGCDLEKRIKFNPSLIGIDSWFKECLQSKEKLQLKWSKLIEDIHPKETQELKRLWYEFGGSKLNAIEDENIFRKISIKAYNYFAGIDDKYNWGIDKRYIIQRFKYIFEALLAEKQDFKKMKPHYLLANNLYDHTLRVHWERICLSKYEPLDEMEMKCEFEKGAKTREFNSHFAVNVNETREQLLARIAEQRKQCTDTQDDLSDD